MSKHNLVYPVIISFDASDQKDPYLVYIPAFHGYAAGKDESDALARARKFVISQFGKYRAEHRHVPQSTFSLPRVMHDNSKATLIDVAVPHQHKKEA
ncbi:hypothetical protein IV38_GL001004 [Lactobacillus selangorensis]|uniref:HicB-like antitoxin of toxin-antitoxin system domain-containing protein n=1 Tax=Lactobacillus selangorensis TaxID=81857 RepID=A0A0R2G5V3_9LACO|nr:hypothetical protein [Lactobacillus selangorensis]KRN28799.1 hypothetical protein IV38_GL001004 [Lactobacillus selangorensis]KRN32791.1 hypothetical protein IV40_GL000849 [Lactobacillus selangorensis]